MPYVPITKDTLTLDGIDVRVGQIWRDLDRRKPGRRCRVVEIHDGRAIMEPDKPHQSRKAQTSVSIKRMHNHSTGWELVK